MGMPTRTLAHLTLAALVMTSLGCGPIIVTGTSYTGRLQQSVVDTRDGWWVPWKVAVLDVEGVITGDGTLGLFRRRESTVARLREELRRVEEDPLVKAVVLRVNSPGGGVTASDILYHELRSFRERTKKPVVVCVLDVGASGAYYLALAGDCIVACPTSVVGGIGVLLQLFNVEGLLSKIGLKGQTIKSGPKKDLGSPLRPMTPEERALLEGIVKSLHERFVRLVAERRGLALSRVRELADGRIFTAREARELGLIDQVGYLSEAIAKAKELAGIGRARVVMYHRPLGYKGSIYAGGQQINLLNLDLGDLGRALTGGRPLFWYLWLPGGGAF